MFANPITYTVIVNIKFLTKSTKNISIMDFEIDTA